MAQSEWKFGVGSRLSACGRPEPPLEFYTNSGDSLLNLEINSGDGLLNLEIGRF
jgi:hypothetical protein